MIQRLFATGMLLQSTVRVVANDPAAAIERIGEAVDDLDLTIKEIRTAIFGLEQGRARLTTACVARSSPPSARRPIARLRARVILDGPVDSGIDRAIGTEILATLREALSNVSRHANASRVEVEVVVGRDVCLSCRRRRGRSAIAARADGQGSRQHGAPGPPSSAARCELRRREPHGTVLEWRVAARLDPEGQ